MATETAGADRALVAAGCRRAGRRRFEPAYRPYPNLQYWVADTACVPPKYWESITEDEWPVYAPRLIIEVISRANMADKLSRQRITAMSGGTEEFWIVNRDRQTVEVSRLDSVRVYGAGETIPLPLFNGSLPVDDIFA